MFERAQFALGDLSVQVPFQLNTFQEKAQSQSFLVEPSPTALQPILDDAEASHSEGQPLCVDEKVEHGYGARTDLELLSTAIGERPDDIEAMYAYKLQSCPNKLPHDWTQCRFAHDGEVAKR